jgi:N-acetyl-anhydromuramyl-L-alanine amidase AmpD
MRDILLALALGAGEVFWPADPLVPPFTLEEYFIHPSPTIEDRPVSWGYNPLVTRDLAAIDTIVVHACYNAESAERYSVPAMLRIFKRENVATHYLIDRDGRIYRLVPEYKIAYHAGSSKMPDGRSGVNRFSIGIELLGHPTEAFAEDQYQALKYLQQDIGTRVNIRHIQGHGEIAPGRKTDPENIDWGRVR